jgi:hypothetical protein
VSIIDPITHHVSPFGGFVSPGLGEALGVGVGVVSVGVGVGVGVGVRVDGVGFGVGLRVGVADLVTVADREGTGRADLAGTDGGRRVRVFVLAGRGSAVGVAVPLGTAISGGLAGASR